MNHTQKRPHVPPPSLCGPEGSSPLCHFEDAAPISLPPESLAIPRRRSRRFFNGPPPTTSVAVMDNAVMFNFSSYDGRCLFFSHRPLVFRPCIMCPTSFVAAHPLIEDPSRASAFSLPGFLFSLRRSYRFRSFHQAPFLSSLHTRAAVPASWIVMAHQFVRHSATRRGGCGCLNCDAFFSLTQNCPFLK